MNGYHRVLVIGGAGFVGSVLCRHLQALGCQVRVVDLGIFGTDHLPPEVEVIQADMLCWQEAWTDGIDAVINLAGLSNDPMADYSPALNMQINAAAAGLAALMCKRAGVRRFIQASSCSVYGRVDVDVDETWPARPSYPYGLAKLMAETAISALADDFFHPIILRKGTVCGWSPRMRFDLIVNTMLRTALTDGVIRVHDPDAWRPLLDVRDAAAAYVAALRAPLTVTGVFNIATGNYTTMQVAEVVAQRLRRAGYSVDVVVTGQRDPRSYRVSTAKAAERLQFVPSISLPRMVDDLLTEIQRAGPHILTDPRCINIQQWQEWLSQRSVPAARGNA